jgi:integrase
MRRNAGDGSLYYRSDKGLWVAQHQGVYRYSKDKDKAQEKLHELLSKADASKPENITVSTMIDQWFDYQKQNIKPATAQRYREVIRIYVKPAFGHNKLRQLTAYAVQQQYSKWLASGISPNTLSHVHTILSSSFKRSAKWQLVGHNTIQDVDAPKIKRKEIDVFTPGEVKVLLSEAKYSPLEAVFVLALSTGMRGGEILALQPQDYHNGKLDIRRTLFLPHFPYTVRLRRKCRACAVCYQGFRKNFEGAAGQDTTLRNLLPRLQHFNSTNGLWPLVRTL